MSNDFIGFSESAVKFFEDLGKNNNKDWFQENKGIYEKEVKAKSHLLVDKMSEAFAGSGMPFVADKKKSLFRINRDIRFSKDKSPYKTNMGVFFPFGMVHIDVKDPMTVGLYFHFDANEVFVAGGLYMPDGKAQLAIRTRIAEEWNLFDSIVNGKEFLKEFPTFSFDDSLKNTPKGFPKEHPGDKYLRVKSYTVYSPLKFKDISNVGLVGILMKKAEIIRPFLEFLRFALENY